jgi:hypothetical protein
MDSDRQAVLRTILNQCDALHNSTIVEVASGPNDRWAAMVQERQSKYLTLYIGQKNTILHSRNLHTRKSPIYYDADLKPNDYCFVPCILTYTDKAICYTPQKYYTKEWYVSFDDNHVPQKDGIFPQIPFESSGSAPMFDNTLLPLELVPLIVGFLSASDQKNLALVNKCFAFYVYKPLVDIRAWLLTSSGDSGSYYTIKQFPDGKHWIATEEMQKNKGLKLKACRWKLKAYIGDSLHTHIKEIDIFQESDYVVKDKVWQIAWPVTFDKDNAIVARDQYQPYTINIFGKYWDSLYFMISNQGEYCRKYLTKSMYERCIKEEVEISPLEKRNVDLIEIVHYISMGHNERVANRRCQYEEYNNFIKSYKRCDWVRKYGEIINSGLTFEKALYGAMVLAYYWGDFSNCNLKYSMLAKQYTRAIPNIPDAVIDAFGRILYKGKTFLPQATPNKKRALHKQLKNDWIAKKRMEIFPDSYMEELLLHNQDTEITMATQQKMRKQFLQVLDKAYSSLYIEKSSEYPVVCTYRSDMEYDPTCTDNVYTFAYDSKIDDLVLLDNYNPLSIPLLNHAINLPVCSVQHEDSSTPINENIKEPHVQCITHEVQGIDVVTREQTLQFADIKTDQNLPITSSFQSALYKKYILPMFNNVYISVCTIIKSSFSYCNRYLPAWLTFK